MLSSEQLAVYGQPEAWSRHIIVCLHALADQIELLEKLDMTIEESVVCDVYWDLKGLLFFISFNVSSSPGVYLYLKEDVEHPYSFSIKTTRKPLTRNVIDSGLDFLCQWINSNELKEYEDVDSVYCLSKNEVIQQS